MFMRLHSRLMETSRFYNWWHHLPIVSIVHFAAVIAVGSVLATTIQNEAADQLIESQLAQTILSVGSGSASLGSLTSQLLMLAKHYDGTAGEADTQLRKMRQVANMRTQLLLSLAQGNPKAFILNALPESISRQLPSALAGLVEEPIDVEGALTVIHFDAPPNQAGEKTEYILTSGSKRYQLHFAGFVPEGMRTGATVRVHGLALSSELVPIATAGGSGTALTSPATAGAPTGPQKTLVILFNFTDNASQPFTPADVASTVFTAPSSTNSYYKEASFGTLSMAGDVVGWYTIPYGAAGCDANYNTWSSAAQQAAIVAGVPVNTYSHIIYMWNNSSGCSWGGIGTIGGAPSSAWIPDWYLTPTVIAHEFGHNILAHHAQLLSCAPGTVGPYSTCTLSEYGDPSDCMGSCWTQYFQFVGARKLGENWLPASSVQTITGSGTYTVTAEEVNDGGIKLLKVAKPDTAEAYYVSLRRPAGFDALIPAAYTTGANIHIWNGDVSTQTKLVNGPLSDGGALVDAGNGITFTQVSHTPTSVTVSIQFTGAKCVPAAPTVTLSPASQGSSAGGTLTYGVTVKNNDSSICSGSIFNLTSTVPSGWADAFGQSSLSINAGNSANTTLSLTSQMGVADGTYPISTTAVGGTGTGSASGSYVVYTDTVGPLLSINAPADGTNVNSVKGNNLKISTTATDPSGVGNIVIFFDGKMVQTCAGATSCVGSVPVRQLSPGSHAISATATDKVGNTSTKSVSVTK